MSFLFEQLPLAVQLRDDATFDNFFIADNALLVEQLRLQQAGTGERYIYLYGASGSGRSHLLQAACLGVDNSAKAAVYLPLQDLLEYPPQQLFDGLEQLSLVCLDDIDAVITKAQWQSQLFHLFNRLEGAGTRLLVSANCAVRQLPIELADLASRLSWGAVHQLQSLSDPQRIAAFQFRAARRGLVLEDEVAQYVYHRSHRDTETLLLVLDKLDKASLEQQRKLTVPFVKTTLGW